MGKRTDGAWRRARRGRLPARSARPITEFDAALAGRRPSRPPGAEHPDRAVRRRRLLRLRLLRLADCHADHRRARRARPALHRLPHHRDVLDHAGRAAHRAQPPLRRRRLPRQLRQRLSRLPRQDRARSRHARRDAAAARLPQLHGRQVARHAVVRDRAHGALRRLAAGARLRPLLRLHGRGDRPVRAGAGARQHAASTRRAPSRAATTSPPISSTSRSASSPTTCRCARRRRGSSGSRSAPATRRTRRRAI